MTMKRYRRRRRRIPSWLILVVALLVAAGITVKLICSTKPTKPADNDTTQTEQKADPDKEKKPENEKEPEPTKPAYEVIDFDGDTERYDTVYRAGDAAFEVFDYSADLAERYADLVSKTAGNLKGTASVYDLTIPLSSAITLPDKLRDDIGGYDQEKALSNVEGMMSGDVKVVPLYDALMQHRTEYIYFRTDHHWTARGAYYAYAEFCKAKGITAEPLDSYETQDFNDFLGTFYRDSGNCEQLGANPDTVTAYLPKSQNATLKFTDTSGDTYDWKVIFDVTDYPSELKYSTFIAADNPYTIIENPDATSDESCVVVKESFGNAFVPFLVDHYKTIHVIDYRYWNGNLVDFVKTNNVNDVLFVNNLSAIRSSYLMGKLPGIL